MILALAVSFGARLYVRSQARELEAFWTMSAFFVHDLKNAAASLNLMLKNLPVHFDDPAFREDAARRWQHRPASCGMSPAFLRECPFPSVSEHEDEGPRHRHVPVPDGGGGARGKYSRPKLLVVDDGEDIRVQMKWALPGDDEVTMAGGRDRIQPRVGMLTATMGSTTQGVPHANRTTAARHPVGRRKGPSARKRMGEFVPHMWRCALA
jgi:hypothetical protein